MGGRWMITTVQVTFIIKGELDDDQVKKYVALLRTQGVKVDMLLDVLLDESSVKDIEV